MNTPIDLEVERNVEREEVVIVRTGIANTASVVAAFERLGTRPVVTEERRRIDDAPLLVLPGVGAFGAAMRALDELGLRDTLARRVRSGRATLAICLGMQLLCEASEESPGVAGLGVVPATVRRFEPGARVPQLGWNRVEPVASELLEPGDAYFANTYRLDALPDGWAGATAEYVGTFACALERGAVLACQFHPELSGDWGARLLARWVERAKEA